MQQNMKIANIDLGPRPVLLAPMEDVTDPAFRLMCKRFGADMVYTEFVSADALIRSVSKTEQKLNISSGQRSRSRHAPEHPANARNHPRRGRCGEDTRHRENPPRLGCRTQNYRHPVTLAEQLQDCGISALTIHGRTRAQMYTGEADWTFIGEVKRNPRMRIPIIGNGDVTTPQRALECFERYGVDAIMIGRASFGRPWIFKEVKHYLETGEELSPLTPEWCMNVLRQEVEDSVNLLDERRGILHVRRHLAASPLFKGLPNFRDTRIAMLRAETKEELYAIFDEIGRKFFGL